jgi:cyclic pyranopterin monophosphate synthase
MRAKTARQPKLRQAFKFRRTFRPRLIMGELSHFDATGASRMVDVGAKPISRRVARASGLVRMGKETLSLIRDRKAAKGDVLEVARLAGIMAAKRTSELIPLCHNLPLEAVSIEFDFPDDQSLQIRASVEVDAKTGVEMEALTAVSVTALTVYDMCKSVDRGMTIGPVQLEEKSGGRSGHWRRPNS